MKRNWAMIARDETRPQWAGIYVTMNGKGQIVINQAAHKRMDLAEAFHILYDSVLVVLHMGRSVVTAVEIVVIRLHAVIRQRMSGELPARNAIAVSEAGKK